MDGVAQNNGGFCRHLGFMLINAPEGLCLLSLRMEVCGGMLETIRDRREEHSCSLL